MDAKQMSETKRVYASPILEEYGELTKITQNKAGGTPSDSLPTIGSQEQT